MRSYRFAKVIAVVGAVLADVVLIMMVFLRPFAERCQAEPTWGNTLAQLLALSVAGCGYYFPLLAEDLGNAIRDRSVRVSFFKSVQARTLNILFGGTLVFAGAFMGLVLKTYSVGPLIALLGLIFLAAEYLVSRKPVWLTIA